MRAKIQIIKDTMRDNGYSFQSFTHNGFCYVAGLSVKDNETFFEVTDDKGQIIYQEII